MVTLEKKNHAVNLKKKITTDDDLFVDVTKRSTMPFQLFAGPRGDGKTFSALRGQVCDEIECGNWIQKEWIVEKFIYLRRRQQEIQIATSQTANPFKSINLKYNINVYPVYSSKDKYSVFYMTTDNGQRIPVGYGAALSTFSSLRGVNFEDVGTIIFDEAVPEASQVKIRGEGNALLNLYETVNRNREFFGFEPVRLYIISNAVDLGCDLYSTLKVISPIAHMLDSDQKRATFKDRGLYIELLMSESFRKIKSETALFKLVKESEFSKFALDNQFVNNDRSHIRKVNLNEYIPMCTYSSTYTIYYHKSKELYYCAEKNPDSSQTRFAYSNSNFFRQIYKPMYKRAINYDIINYDSYATKIAMDSILLELRYRC